MATSVSDTTSGNAERVEVMTLRIAAPREQEKDVARDNNEATLEEAQDEVAGPSCVGSRRDTPSGEARGLLTATSGRRRDRVTFKFV